MSDSSQALVDHASVGTLVPPDEYLIDRQQEAADVVSLILAARSKFVVLHGPPDSGKTLLLTQWVIPGLRDSTKVDVLYGECTQRLPNEWANRAGVSNLQGALRGDSILVLDHFERLLDLPHERQRAELDALFLGLSAGSPRQRVVLVTEDRQLTGVYALASYDANAASIVRRLRSITVPEALRGLGSLSHDQTVQYAPDVISAIADDCVMLSVQSWSDTLPLVRVVHDWAVRHTRDAHTIAVTLRDYEAAGKAKGILRAHIERQIAAMDAERKGDGEIGRAILEQAAAANEQGLLPVVETLAPRLGVEPADVERVIGALTTSRRLLRRQPGGTLRVVPAQALGLLDEDLKASAPEVRRAQFALEEGWREWQRSGAIFSTQRFGEVHAQRRNLSTTDGQVRFLLQCALLQSSEQPDDSASYWLRRVVDREDRIDVLLRATLNDDAGVRRRAAALLAAFDDPEAVHRLTSVALADFDAGVRVAAADSLRGKKDHVKETILREVESETSPHRVAAIEALRICADADVVAILKRELDNPRAQLPTRRAAVGVLSKLETPEAVDALLDVALRDPDTEDRDAAAHGLASIKNVDLNRRIIAAMNAGRRPWRWVARIGLGTLALLALFAGSTVAYALHEMPVPLILYLVITTLLMVPTAVLMRRLAGRTRVGSGWALVMGVLFLVNAFTILPVIHGLAHYAIGRRRRAALLMGIEAVSILFGLVLWRILYASDGWQWLSWVYLTLGVALFVATYFYDVLEVFIGALVLRRATMLRDHRALVCDHLFTNPTAAALVRDALDGGGEVSPGWARHVLKRFGHRVPLADLIRWLQDKSVGPRRIAFRALRATKREETVGALHTLWSSADAALRRTIARILWSRPNARSMELLKTLRPEMTRLQRQRVALAEWTYPLAVWPWSVRLAVLATLPTIAILLFDGWRVHKNPAWSQIVALRQPRVFTEDRGRKPKIVEFLAAVYPGESANALFDLLKRTSDGSDLALEAALVQALASMDSVSGVDPGALRTTLLESTARFSDSIASGYPDRARTSIDVLDKLFVTRDTQVADAAIDGVVRFVASAPDSRANVHVRSRAIAAIGRLPYQRSLATLDSLLTRHSRYTGEAVGRWFGDSLRAKLESTAGTASTLAIPPDSSEGRKRVLLTLGQLRNKTPEINRQIALLDSISARVARDSIARASEARPCDRNDDGACDWRDSVLAQVDSTPALEYVYTDLVSHYEDNRDVHGAVHALEQIVRDKPRQVWPRKTLAALLHETVATTDTSAFIQSYEVMRELRALDQYKEMRDTAPDDHARIEADFIEVVFSARRYQEADSLAQSYLRSAADTGRSAAARNDTTRLFNSALFAYLSAVMVRDSAAAASRLDKVQTMVQQWSGGFRNNWQYPGTEAFLRGSGLPQDLIKATLSLCRGGRWSAKDAADAFAANRSALWLVGRR